MSRILSTGVVLEGSDNLTLTPPPCRDKRKYDRASKNTGRYKKFIQPENGQLNITILEHAPPGTPILSAPLRCGLASCGKAISARPKNKIRGRQHFCCREHYWQMVRERGNDYRPWRQGQRRARKLVSRYFALLPKHIVHHHDRDNRNNELSNLAVFASHSQHMAFHRGDPSAVPIWDGALVEALRANHAQEGICTT